MLLLAESARGGGGWRVGHGAARLFGVSSGSSLHRRQPPSPAKQPSGPGGCRGAKSTSSRSFPQAAPRHRGLCPHTRAPTAARSLRSRKKNQNSKPKDAGMRKQGWREVRRPRESPSRGRSTAAGKRGQVRQSVPRSPERTAAPAGPASGARAAPAAWGTTLPPALPHMSGLPAWGTEGWFRGCRR